MSLIPESRLEFIARYADTFESSLWIAEQAWLRGPFVSVDELHRAMCQVVLSAGEDQVLTLLRAHPELAGPEAKACLMTEHSTQEQGRAGLANLSPAMHLSLSELNKNYREKFGFPFIIAVRFHNAESIIEQAQKRLINAREIEIENALEQIFIITACRLGLEPECVNGAFNIRLKSG